MNTFNDLEHALLTGVVLATMRSKGIDVELMLNSAEDTTPYLKLTLDGAEAVIVVLPRE